MLNGKQYSDQAERHATEARMVLFSDLPQQTASGSMRPNGILLRKCIVHMTWAKSWEYLAVKEKSTFRLSLCHISSILDFQCMPENAKIDVHLSRWVLVLICSSCETFSLKDSKCSRKSRIH